MKRLIDYLQAKIKEAKDKLTSYIKNFNLRDRIEEAREELAIYNI